MKMWALVAWTFVAVSLAAQSLPAPPTEAQQFDFWLGEWDVITPAGKKAGTNRIEKMAGGWGLLENWTGAGGYEGKSLNSWLPEKRQWQQFWVGTGGALELRGGINDQGEMVLEGKSIGADGLETLERITWTPNADGTLRQHWQQSTDRGATWMTAFDGLYRRKASEGSAK